MDVCVIFLKVGEIDTLKEQYEADVMVKTKWKEPALNKENNVSAEQIRMWYITSEIESIQYCTTLTIYGLHDIFC